MSKPFPSISMQGNKLACGSVYDLEAETKALDEWSKKDKATALCQFCVERDIHAQRLYEWRDASPAFAETLNKAKLRIATRLREKLHDKKKPYNYGLFQREIGFHDKFLNDYEEEVKDKDEKRRASALRNENINLEIDKQKVLDIIQQNKRNLSNNENKS